jgi:hypothetical protein
MASRKLVFKPADCGTPHHFFASSVAEWRTNTDMEKLIADMRAVGYVFNLFYVPVPADAPYKISMYTPQVEGTIMLGFFEPKGK